LLLIEDAAQAHLASWKGESVGSIGHTTCFSFFPGKNLGAMGDAGAVVTNDPEVAERIRKLRDHGRTDKYVHDELGVSSRLDGLQAAVLRVKLRHLPAWTEARRQLADHYRDRLGDLLVPWEDGAVHHLLVGRVASGRRNAIQRNLAEAGVATGVHYPVPLSEQPGLSAYASTCHAVEAAAAEVLSLPMDPLMTDAEVDSVCDLLAQACA
jgi:dTDP-4-amino-4,6-dideoxygalactose transaminase